MPGASGDLAANSSACLMSLLTAYIGSVQRMPHRRPALCLLSVSSGSVPVICAEKT